MFNYDERFTILQANHMNYWIQIIFVLKIILRLGSIKSMKQDSSSNLQ